MFFGRTNELDTLNRLYSSNKFEFAVIYGRRRVGKTALLREFAKDKNAIFFTGVETSAKQNLENLSNCISEFQTGIMANSTFASYQIALEYVFRLAQTQRIVLILDEYPFLARASKSLSSTIQMLIDRNQDNSKLFLILCGSSMSYMEEHVLAYKAPLYGRRTAQLKLIPFDFFDACRCFTHLSDTDKALAYGMVGGTPQYMMQIDDHLSIEANLKNIFLNPASPMFDEIESLLNQEMREPANYNAVMSAIAGGCSRLNEISQSVGESTSTCTMYLKNLIALDLIMKETPYGEKASRKTIYTILDPMFRFWYRFIQKNTFLISRGASDVAYDAIYPDLPMYMGGIFEEICKQYLWRLLLTNQCAVNFRNIGRWWGTNPKTKSQEEIDIMGDNGKTALFAECKWTNERVDRNVLETLMQRSKMFSHEDAYYYLFAKTGFTKGCTDLAQQSGKVTLISYPEMLRQFQGGEICL